MCINFRFTGPWSLKSQQIEGEENVIIMNLATLPSIFHTNCFLTGPSYTFQPLPM